MNAENRYKYDPNVQKAEILEQIGANLILSYSRTHRVLTVASRDIYQIHFYTITDNGSIYQVLFEDDTEEHPEEPDCVRMRSPLGGIVFEPMKGDPTKCNIVMYAEANLGGYIPEFVQKQALGDTAMSLVNLRKVMVDYVKQNQKEL
jgi:hypothetical protein